MSFFEKLGLWTKKEPVKEPVQISPEPAKPEKAKSERAFESVEGALVNLAFEFRNKNISIEPSKETNTIYVSRVLGSGREKIVKLFFSDIFTTVESKFIRGNRKGFFSLEKTDDIISAVRKIIEIIK